MKYSIKIEKIYWKSIEFFPGMEVYLVCSNNTMISSRYPCPCHFFRSILSSRTKTNKHTIRQQMDIDWIALLKLPSIRVRYCNPDRSFKKNLSMEPKLGIKIYLIYLEINFLYKCDNWKVLAWLCSHTLLDFTSNFRTSCQ